MAPGLHDPGAQQVAHCSLKATNCSLNIPKILIVWLRGHMILMKNKYLTSRAKYIRKELAYRRLVHVPTISLFFFQKYFFFDMEILVKKKSKKNQKTKMFQRFLKYQEFSKYKKYIFPKKNNFLFSLFVGTCNNFL